MEVWDAFQQLIGEDGGPIGWSEMCVRALIIFSFGLVLLRLAHKRAFGRWSALDIILSVIIGSNLSRALTGTVPLVPTLLATSLLVVLHAVLVTLAARFKIFGPMLKGRPARLIHDGEVDRKAMLRHGIGEHDLEEALRNKGLEAASEVRDAYLERSGDISVVKR
jgi:uncharacterized membrane protein YcaP (DUF421 family)